MSIDEFAYDLGHKTAWRQVLAEAVSHLDLPEANAERWRIERAETVAALRTICIRFGDNDWPDDLHLADVLLKHLRNHLEVRSETPEP